MPKKGKDVLAIMLGGKGGKPPEEEAPEDEYEEEDPGYSEAFSESAEAALEAVNAGDSEGFGTALKDAILTCLEERGDE
jgi:hypothetical protein